MNLLAVNLLLAVVWAGLQGSYDFFTLFSGYLIGFGTLWVTRPLFNLTTLYFVRSWRIVKLVAYFLWELLASSVQVAWQVLMPKKNLQPAVVEMPLDVTSDLEILLTSSLISLTPGTLSLDVSDDRKTLFVHAMFGEDPEALVASMKSGMERRVAEVFNE